ncbi:MAG: glycosyltransferase family 4 protein [Acidimicrobiales bacterium]|nr:glycosyltransferase family 4 protein [Acidimicrobiales bacterium]
MTTSLSARVLLANQLARLSEVEWTVVSGDEYPDPVAGTEAVVVPIRRELSPAAATSFANLYRHFRSRHYDFVQTHTPMASLLGLPAARLAGRPTLYTIHGALYFDGNGWLANLAGWCFERWCCTWATRVLVQSREDADRLPAVGICRRSRLRYVGNGIVVDRFTEPVPPAYEDERPRAVMVSRLVREKGCSDFLELAAALADRAEFVHVGPVEHDQRDAITDDEMDAARRAGVRFVGGVDDVRPYLASATLVVLPSYREGIPRVAMEAAAMGRPVVAYDIRGMREVIDPASGLLVPRGDRAALRRRVESLLADPARCRELGAACRERVLERFAEDGVIERLRAVYAEVVDGSARSRNRSRSRSGDGFGDASAPEVAA